MPDIVVNVGTQTFIAVDAGWQKNGADVFSIYDIREDFVADCYVGPYADVEAEAIKVIEQELCYA